MLPSGREIAAQFGVSLATAAKVATGLQALGLVTSWFPAALGEAVPDLLRKTRLAEEMSVQP